MLKIEIIQVSNTILGYHITGHANYAPYGKDIVCAAVSVLAISTKNALKDIINVDVEVQEQPGDMLVQLNNVDTYNTYKETQVILKSFVNAVINLAHDYPNNIEVINTKQLLFTKY
jgi:uncharacterized protein YsxB (DUF464 family)